MTTDLGRCCDVAAHCDTLSCGHGFTPVGASVFQHATSWSTAKNGWLSQFSQLSQLNISPWCLVNPLIYHHGMVGEPPQYCSINPEWMWRWVNKSWEPRRIPWPMTPTALPLHVAWRDHRWWQVIWDDDIHSTGNMETPLILAYQSVSIHHMVIMMYGYKKDSDDNKEDMDILGSNDLHRCGDESTWMNFANLMMDRFWSHRPNLDIGRGYQRYVTTATRSWDIHIAGKACRDCNKHGSWQVAHSMYWECWWGDINRDRDLCCEAAPESLDGNYSLLPSFSLQNSW